MKLNQFGIANFRCFSQPVFMGQRPITLNIGPNNSGKSSIMKALQLFQHSLTLKNKYNANNYKFILEIIDSFSIKSFGQPEDYLHFADKGLEYTITLSDELKTQEFQNDEIQITLSYFFPKKHFKTSYNSNKFTFEKEAEGLAQLLKYSIRVNGEDIIAISRDHEPVSTNENEFGFKGEISLSNSFFNLSENVAYKTIKCVFLKDSFTNSEELKKTINQVISNYSSDKISKILEIVANSLDAVILFQSYLTKLKIIDLNRREFSRFFDRNNPGLFSDFINHYYSRDVNNITKTKEILNQILPLFNLPGQVEISEPSDYGFQLFINMSDGSKRNVCDFGSGINQLLPLVLSSTERITSVQEYNSNIKKWEPHYLNSLIMIEEPESNFHPNFQSKLADMFSILNKERNLDFIIETHSEYMVRRFQYLVAKQKISKNDIIINYFWDDNGINKCKQIEFKTNGGLTDTFEHGFYDESLTIQLELFKLSNLN